METHSTRRPLELLINTITLLPLLTLLSVTESYAQQPVDDARPAATAPTTPAANQPTVYEVGDIYLPKSRVYVLVGKTGLGHEHGVVGQIKKGRIDLAAATNAGGLEFDMTTFVADTLAARKFVGLEGTTDASTQQQVNDNMHGPDVLAIGHFPTASFIIRQATKLDRPSQHDLPQYELTGDFWLHGVSRRIKIVAEAEEQTGWTHLRGGFTMLQSQFGITPFTKAFGAIGVADQLTIWGDLWIARQRLVAAQPTTPAR